MRNGRGGWVVLVVILTGLIGGGSAFSAPSPFPSYVEGHGIWEIGSNSRWAIAGGAVKVVRPMSLVTAIGGETQDDIWSSTCSHGAQTVQLSRTVILPGPPSTLTLTLATYTNPGIPTGASTIRSLASFRLIVNGSTAFTVNSSSPGQNGGHALNGGSSSTFTLGQMQRSYFHDGSNSLQVVVEKNPSPAAGPACNTASQKAVVSVAFALQGNSAADMSVNPGKAKVQYLKIVAGQQTQTLDGTFTVHNAGPSAAIAGDFAFVLQLGFEKLTELGAAVQPTAPLGACTDTNANGRLTVDCPYSDFPPGATATVRITLAVDITGLTTGTAVSGQDDLDALWSVSTGNATTPGDTDPNQANNSWMEQF